MRQHFLSVNCQAILFALMCHAQQPGVKHPIFDPILQRNAFYVTAPGNWHFEGVAVPGTLCESFPMAVYRASSPDGLSGVYVLPRFDWSWTTGRNQSQTRGEGCMEWRQITAKQLLNYLVPILNVAFEKEGDPAVVAQLARAQQKRNDETNAKAGANTKVSSDVARYIVRYEINQHPVEEVLDASITCWHQFFPMMGNHLYRCNAFVYRRRAPFGKLQEQASLLLSVQDEVDQQWNRQWMAIWTERMSQQVRALYRAQTAAMLEAGERAGEARMREHQAFMGSMQRQQDIRNMNFAAGQYNKQHATDDFTDYILDCTRLRYGVSVGSNCPARQTAP
jgi:hypothetical protein